MVDSWAWVELFKASESGKKARERIGAAEDVFTPSIVLAELAGKYLREGQDPAIVRRWLGTIVEATQVIDIDPRLAEEAGSALMELRKSSRERGLGRPGLGDAIVLAAARLWDAEVLTGDHHFRRLSGVVWIGD